MSRTPWLVISPGLSVDAVVRHCRPDHNAGGFGVSSRVLPVLGSGNDVTPWSGEFLALTPIVPTANWQGATPVVTLSGWTSPDDDPRVKVARFRR